VPSTGFAELIDYASKHPGRVRIGHPGVGSVGDFCVQLINAVTGAGLVSIPYTGAAPAVAALRAGHIEGVVLALGALSSHIKAGTFRGLVASNPVPEFADIPTMRDLGYEEQLFGIWFSFLAPAGASPTRREGCSSAPSSSCQGACREGKARRARQSAERRRATADGSRDPRRAQARERLGEEDRGGEVTPAGRR
jgi:tripartite-type tricarboxylate transporter receptor subunit TctC